MGCSHSVSLSDQGIKAASGAVPAQMGCSHSVSLNDQGIKAASGAVADVEAEHAFLEVSLDATAVNICVVTLAGNAQLQVQLSAEVLGSELIQRVLAAAQLEPEDYGATLLHEGQTIEAHQPLKQAGIVPGESVRIVQAVMQKIGRRPTGQQTQHRHDNYANPVAVSPWKVPFICRLAPLPPTPQYIYIYIYMGVYMDIWEYMAIYGHIWVYTAICRHTLLYIHIYMCLSGRSRVFLHLQR